MAWVDPRFLSGSRGVVRDKTPDAIPPSSAVDGFHPSMTRFKRYFFLGLAAATVFGAASGCGRGQTVEARGPAAREPETKSVGPSHGGESLQETLAAAGKSIQAGAFEEGAAQIARLPLSGRQFTPEEGVAYRRALSDAYSRALEAASKGDPKAKAAVQILRAAHPR